MLTRSRLSLLVGSCLLAAALVISAFPMRTVSAQTTTKTITPIADAYVIQSYPTTNYGTSAVLRMDTTPITRSYLRFAVSGLNGAHVLSAKLRLYGQSTNTVGYKVYRESNNTWTETGITYNNAPAPGTWITTSPAVTAGQWVIADLSSYIQAEGTYNLALYINSYTSTKLSSRESGAYAPQLVITYDSTAPTATAVISGANPTATVAGPVATATRPAATATAPANLTKVSLTKGPDLIYTGNDTTMKIFWQWTSNTTFHVDWGTTASYGQTSPAVSAYNTTNHLYSYTITGLTPGAKYEYRVVTGSQYSAGSFFAAPVASAADLKFISYGDDRSNPSEHNAVAGQVVKLFQSDPGYQTINLVVGDLVSTGDSDSSWTNEMFAPSLTNIRTELANLSNLPVLGNHEETGALFERYFPMPYVASGYWSFDYGPAHFIMLDQYVSYTSGSAQYNWLKNDLANSTRKWKIIVLHEPGWSANGGHANNTTVQKVLEPLFEQYKVAMVLAGHNHYYARAMVNSIAHLTIGTGGAPLYTPASGQPNIVKTYKGYGYTKFSISGSTLTGSFVNTSGTVIDTFSVTR